MMFKNKCKLSVASLALMICCMTGCNIKQGAWIYFDNGSDETMVVQLGERQVAEIAPGEFERVGVQIGERHFKITCGDEVVFDGVKTIEPPNGMLNPKRYLFNPDGNNRYWTYKIYYCDETMDEDEVEAAMAEGDSANPCNDYQLMPEKDWFRIPGRPYVLTDAPDRLVSHREEDIEIETVFARISKENYQVLQDAKRIKDLPEESLVALQMIMSESMID